MKTNKLKESLRACELMCVKTNTAETRMCECEEYLPYDCSSLRNH